MRSTTARQAGIGIAVAVALVLVTYLIADAASGPLLVTQPGSDTPEEVPVGAVVGFTVLGGAIGIGLAFIARRFRRPRTTFVAAAVVALLLYGIMPFTAAETTATAIWLNAMHLAAAVPIVGLLARSLPAQRTEPAQVATEPTIHT